MVVLVWWKKKKKKTHTKGVFSVNIAKSELYLRYRNCWKLFRILRKKSEFWYHHFWNSTKNMREKKKNGGERKCWISKMYRNSSAQFLLTSCEVCVECPKWKDKKNLWQTNCGNTITEIGEKIFCNNCGNGITENGGEKMWFRNLGRSKKKKCYVYNIFTINHMWLVIISSNLNLTLRLLF